MLNRINFDDFSKAETAAYLEQTIQRHDKALASLRQRITDRDTSFLDFSPESLELLWEWFLRQWDSENFPVGEPLPLWCDSQSRVAPDPLKRDIPDGAYVIIDEIGHYLAEVFLRHVPEATWASGHAPKRNNYIFQNHAVISSPYITDLVPEWPVKVLVIRLTATDNSRSRSLAAEAHENRALLNVYLACTRHING